MNRRTLLVTALCAALTPAVAMAGTIEDTIVSELAAQGYGHVTISKTWLGRLRFVATSDSRQREIIVNARTGEILRDYWEDTVAGGTQTPRIINPDDNRGRDRPRGGSGSDGGGSGSGGSGGGQTNTGGGHDSSDDSHDDRDEKDEEDDKDEKDDKEDEDDHKGDD